MHELPHVADIVLTLGQNNTDEMKGLQEGLLVCREYIGHEHFEGYDRQSQPNRS